MNILTKNTGMSRKIEHLNLLCENSRNCVCRQSYWTVHLLTINVCIFNLSVTRVQWRTCVYYLDIALLIDEEVLWFKVSVDQVKGMQIFKGQNYLWSIKARVGFTAEEKDEQKKEKVREERRENTHEVICDNKTDGLYLGASVNSLLYFVQMFTV